MPKNCKGFTLVEIIVCLIIVGLGVAIAIPGYMNYLTQSSLSAAQNNLVAIYQAQNSNYFTNAAYCPGGTLTAINACLSLNLVDNYFTYACSAPGNGGSPFTCTATSINTPATVETLVSTSSVVLAGGTGCPTGYEAGCNPQL